MTYEDCLGFCLFCCATSNGTTSIAEIAQFLSIYSQNPGNALNVYDLRSCYDENYIAETIEMNYNSSQEIPYTHLRGRSHGMRMNMYDWLFHIGLLVNKQAPGIGTENRHSPSFDKSGENKFDIMTHMPIILQLYAKARDQVRSSNNSKDHKQFWVELHTDIVNNIPRIGGLKALELIQLSSMLGLLPLQFSKYASIQTLAENASDGNRGPVKLLRAVCRKETSRGKNVGPTSQSDLTTIFNSLYDELGSVFGKGSCGIHSVTEALLENTMCELYRILKAYVKLKYNAKTKEEIESYCTMENFMEAFDDVRFHKVLSLDPSVDTFCVFRNRGSNFPLQNFFKVTWKGNKLRLQMFVIDHLQNRNIVHRFQVFTQEDPKEKTELLSWIQCDDNGGGLENSLLSLHSCVLRIYESVPYSEKILNKSYFDEFKINGDKIAWKTMPTSPDLSVDSEKYLLHSKIPTVKKHRSSKMIENNEKMEMRLESMKVKSNVERKKRNAPKKVSRKKVIK